MKLYGIDLRALPVDERGAVHEVFSTHDIAADIVFDNSGDIAAMVVQWDEPAPFPNGFKIPPRCPINEIPPGYLEAYQARFR